MPGAIRCRIRIHLDSVRIVVKVITVFALGTGSGTGTDTGCLQRAALGAMPTVRLHLSWGLYLASSVGQEVG